MKLATKKRKPKARPPIQVDIPQNVLDAVKAGALDIQNLASTWLIESFSPAERSNAFLGLAPALSNAQFWQLFHASWTDFEAIDDILFEDELGSRRDAWEKSYLKREDQKFYESLPREITIFRGQDCDDLVGLAWTTDRDIAISRAKGSHGVLNARPFLIRGLIAKTDVAGAYAPQNEIIIYDFSKDVDIVESDLLVEG